MLSRTGTWENPYGDGMAGRMIVTICGGLSGARKVSGKSSVPSCADPVYMNEST